MKDLVTQAEKLIRLVAPELQDRQIYPILSANLPASFAAAARRLDGWAHPDLDLIMEPELTRRGRWRGRGCGIALSPQTLALSSSRRPRESRQKDFPTRFQATILHELCHMLERGFLDQVDAAPPPRKTIEATAAAFGKADVADNAGLSVHWHEFAFIRTVIHMAFRASALGVPVTPGGMFQAHAYGLSPMYKYTAALGDEPEALRGLTFDQIAETPPPRAFRALWRKDLLRLLLPVQSRAELDQKLSAYDRRRLFIHERTNNGTC